MNWRTKSLWSISSRIISALFAFLLNIILTHTLSQNEMGLFFLSLSVAWGGALMCQFGTSILAVKWVAMSRTSGDETAVRRAIWSLIQFTFLQGLVVGSVLLMVPRPIEIRIIWALWTIALGLQTLLPEILRGFSDLKWASILSGPVPQLISVLILGTVHFAVKDATFYQVASFSIVACFLSSFVGLAVIVSRASPIWGTISYRKFLQETAPIGASLAATYLLSQADLWVCGSLLRHEDVATYGIAQRLTAFVSMPLMVFGSVITPAMAELFAAKDMVGLAKVVRRGTQMTAMFTMFVYVCGLLTAWPALYFLIGHDYVAAYPLFVILGLGQVVHVACGPNGYLLLLCGEQSSAMVSTVIASGVCFVGAFLGGHFFGVKGIAFGSFFALAVQSVWMWSQVRRQLHLSTHFIWLGKWREMLQW